MFKVKRNTYNNTTTLAIKNKMYLKVFLNLYFRHLKKKNPFQCYLILKTPNLFLLLLFTIAKSTSFDLVVDLCKIDVA